MATPTWTDARVERLKELWTSGQSASQIAAELGDVTRNAVIGKVHRLGLASRKTVGLASIKKTATSPVLNVPRQTAFRAPTVVTRGNTAVKLEAETVTAEPRAQIVPIFQYVTLMQLQNSSCRWPIGDPMSPDFRFCGAKTENGATYCSYHACLAYQTKPESRSSRRIGKP